MEHKWRSLIPARYLNSRQEQRRGCCQCGAVQFLHNKKWQPNCGKCIPSSGAIKNNWIPVTDRLPDDGQECWTFSPRGPTWPHDYRVSLHRFRQEEDYQLWDCMTQGANFIVSDNMVTHWQPLERPEAPGE